MNDIANLDIKSHVTASITKAFDTMLSMQIRPSETEPEDNTGINRVVGSLNFAGAAIGIFSIQVTHDFASKMAVEGDAEIKNLIAEITNTVGGDLNSALNDAGFPCIPSTPTLTVGTNFSIKSLDLEQYDRFIFSHDTDSIIVEVGVKTQELPEGSADLFSPDSTADLRNVDLEKVNALDYRGKVSESIVTVFDTMLSLALSPVAEVPASSLEGIRNVASICFAGDVSGTINIHISQGFCEEMAARMLGTAADEIDGDGEVEDLLSEICNIVGGNLKSAVTDTGAGCVFSTPSLTTGSDFTIESLNLEQYERFVCQHEADTVLVEMGLKISESAQTAGQQGNNVRPDVEDAPSEKPQASPSAKETPKTDTAPKKVLSPEDLDLGFLLDIPLEITVELGRTKIEIQDLLRLGPGSPVKLSRLEGEPVDILANDTLIAKGEVVIQNEKYGIRITEITSRMDRLKIVR